MSQPTDRARLAYEAFFGHSKDWDDIMPMIRWNWQAVADALDAANEDTARLDQLEAIPFALDLKFKMDQLKSDSVPSLRRLFLPSPVRASLLATGAAEWVREIEPQRSQRDWLTPQLLHCAPSAYIVGNLCQLEHPLGGPLTCIKIPTPPNAEYWIPEPWSTLAMFDRRMPRHLPLDAPIKYITDSTITCSSPYPWGRVRSAAQMLVKWSRLHVTVASVRVERREKWCWVVGLRRIQ